MVKFLEVLVFIAVFGSAFTQNFRTNARQQGSTFQGQNGVFVSQSSQIENFQQQSSRPHSATTFAPDINVVNYGPGFDPFRPILRPAIKPVSPPITQETIRPAREPESVYGNDTPGDLAKIHHEYFQIDPIGNYNFG